VPDSDVDLAVEGLAGDDYWRAWRMVERICWIEQQAKVMREKG
jgi:hypothetical protein